MILVTGGAGSIGSEVARHLARMGAGVRVLDINEEGLWSLKMELPDVDVFLGDVRSAFDLHSAMRDVDWIIHCAALKHVPFCEQNSTMAWAVNFEGARTVMEAAKDRRVVFVSTDKAIEPTSVMGKTKRAAEAWTIGHGGNAVRFGNVIGTRGSLLPMVLRCKELGRPIPLTDPTMTRWFMTAQDAVGLIVEALNASQGGQTFTPHNPKACNVSTFVWACRNLLAPQLDIKIVGMRPGERVHEPMQLRSGEVVWSNDDRFQMTLTQVHEVIAFAQGMLPMEAAA